MTEYLLDSSAWIDYLDGVEPAGAFVCDAIEEKEAATCVLSLAEVSSRMHQKRIEPKPATDFMQRETPILPILPSVAARAGQFRNERRKLKPSFSLIDAMIYLTARENGLTLVTKDQDFDGLEGVELRG